MCICVSLFFFFKQETAYERRISDWSSDVCSSDLPQFGMKMARKLGARLAGHRFMANHQPRDLGLVHDLAAAMVDQRGIVIARDPHPAAARREQIGRAHV